MDIRPSPDNAILSAVCPCCHEIQDYLKKAWKKMTRARAIGKAYDEELLDVVDRAIDELNGFNKGFVQIQKLNDILLS